MIKNANNIFLLFAFLLLSENAFAQNKTDEIIETKEKTLTKYENLNESEDKNKPTGLGLTFYLGIEGGYAHVSAEDTFEESTKKGYHLDVKGISYLYINQIGLDFGLGFYRNHVAGTEPEKFKNDQGNEENIENTKITTQALQLDFNAKYLVGSGFGLGPSAMVFFGEDTGFSPGKAAVPETVFAGLIFHKDLHSQASENLHMRFGLRGLVSLNLSVRTAYIALASFEIGIPVLQPKTNLVEKELVEIRQRTQKKRVEKYVEKIIVKEKNRFMFDSQTINFETDKSVLSEKSVLFLQKLGKALQEDANLWTSVLIEGHTDKRGSKEHNAALSEARAGSVKQTLLSTGIPANKIFSQGFGFDVPFDQGNDPLALAKNRRVEMNFSGVANPQKLRKIIESSK
jgi:outer membrane protein OmpA-like peptidoglycan-associated protein